MNFKFAYLLAACGVGLSLAAAEVATMNVPEEWRNAADFTQTADGALQIGKSKLCQSATPFAVDPTKTYKLTLKARCAPGSKPSHFYAIFVPISEEGHVIEMPHACNIRRTEGILAAEAKSGDTVLKVKANNPDAWGAYGGWCVCFNAKDDLSDIPNREISSGIASVAVKDGIVEVTLKSALRMDYPAETKVRIHAGGSYMYVIQATPLPEKWTEYTGIVKGIAPGWSNKTFPTGTATSAIGLMTNWNVPMHSTQTEIKDVKVEEVE